MRNTLAPLAPNDLLDVAVAMRHRPGSFGPFKINSNRRASQHGLVCCRCFRYSYEFPTLIAVFVQFRSSLLPSVEAPDMIFPSYSGPVLFLSVDCQSKQQRQDNCGCKQTS